MMRCRSARTNSLCGDIGDGRRHNKGFLTRKDAKAFLVLTEGEVVRGVHTPESTPITVAAAALPA